jgi:thiol:disulfide interchange protein DsbC
MRVHGLLMLGLVFAGGAMAAKQQDQKRVRDAIAALAPEAKIESLRPSAMPGVYEVVMGGAEVYVSADGKFLLTGALWDVSAGKNLTEVTRAGRRKDALATIEADQRIVFAPEQPRHRITVFTDLDCGYCRKLHDEVTAYNDAGISVEYVLFPRGGMDSPSHAAAVSVWCADDRRQALTLAKRGEPVAPKICPNPIREEFQIGQRIGISSTPTIVTEGGNLILGYVPPQQLLAQLDAARSVR